MDVSPVSAQPPVAPSQPTTSEMLDDAALFEAMAQGALSVGVSLLNSLMGETLATLAEPFGDPDK